MSSGTTRRWLPRWSLTVRSRLTALMVLTLAAAVAVVWSTLPNRIEADAIEELSLRLRNTLRVAATELGPLLRTEDWEGARRVLNSIRGLDEVEAVALVSPEGRVLAAPGFPASEPLPLGALGRWDDEFFYLSHPIRVRAAEESRALARLLVRASLQSVHAEVTAIRRVIAVGTLVLLGLGIATAFAISHIATGPIRAMSRTAEEIASGDRAARATVGGTDEVAGLTRSFNRMLDRLETFQAELEGSRATLEQLLAGVPAAIAVVNRDLTIHYANRGAQLEVAGGADPVGEGLHTLLDRTGNHGAAAVVEGIVRDCLAGRRDVEEEAVFHGDELTRVVAIRGSKVVMDGAERVLIVGLDVTHLRKAEEALRIREDELRQAQKMEAVGRLAGGVAHDFNNLLTVISGQSELARLELEESHPAEASVDDIQKAADRAAELTKQLLAFSRKGAQALEPTDLNAVVRSVGKLLTRLMGEQIELQVELGADIPTIRADHSQLEQVFMNLAVNARDAMPAGGVFRIVTARSGTGVRLEVTDTGTGMDPEVAAKVFEPFFTTKGVGKGTGLGLSTVYGIVQQHGGTIRVDSKPGRGTSFFIELRGVSEEVAARGLPTEEVDLTLELPKDLHVLLVEDEDMVRDFLVRQMEIWDLQVTAISRPQDALQGIMSGKLVPDMLLTDVVMPGMTGVALADAVAHELPDLPVVFMTGYAREELDRIGVAAEQGQLLQKPFSAKQLYRSLASLWARRTPSGPLGHRAAE